MIGRVLLDQFINNPISQENSSLMQTAVFDYSKILEHEKTKKDQLESENKYMNIENEIAELQLKKKRAEITDIQQHKESFHYLNEFLMGVAAQLIGKMEDNMKIFHAYVWNTDPLGIPELEEKMCKGLKTLFAPKCLQIDNEVLTIFEMLNSKKGGKKIKLKTLKEVRVNTYNQYLKLVYNNNELLDHCMIIMVSSPNLFSTLHSVFDVICKNFYLELQTSEASDRSFEIRTELQKLPSMGTLDWQPLREKADQAMATLADTTNYTIYQRIKTYDMNLQQLVDNLSRSQANRPLIESKVHKKKRKKRERPADEEEGSDQVSEEDVDEDDEGDKRPTSSRREDIL